MADIAVTRAAVTTGAVASTQDITVTGFGTPSAALLVYTSGVTDGTIAASSRWGIGATDGTTSAAYITRATDAQATSSTGRNSNADRVILSISDGATTVDGYCTGALITDGIQLTVGDQMPAGYLVTVVLFSSNCSASVINWNLGTVTTAQDVNTVGFTPDVVFAFSHGDALAGGSGFNITTFGVAVNDGSATQRSIGTRNRTSTASGQPVEGYYDNRVGTSITATATTMVYDLLISDFDASGFSVTASASAGSDYVTFLSIKLPTGDQFKLFDVTVPTTGSIAVTSPNFTPYFGLMNFIAGPTAANTLDDSNGLGLSLAVFDASAIYTNSISSQDAADPTVEKSLADDSFTLLKADGTTETTSSGYAFDSQGWDVTLTANPAAAILGFGLAIGDATTTVTGSGTPAAQSATATGAATRTITGTGTPTAQAATASGTAEREITGSGAPQAQASTVAGTGQVGSMVTGSGTPAAQNATVSGTALRVITGTGTPTAQSSTAAGTATRIITGSGAIAANDATVVGSGAGLQLVTGTGSAVSGSASTTGVALRIVTGSGALQAQAATVSGYDLYTPSRFVAVAGNENRTAKVASRARR